MYLDNQNLETILTSITYVPRLSKSRIMSNLCASRPYVPRLSKSRIMSGPRVPMYPIVKISNISVPRLPKYGISLYLDCQNMEYICVPVIIVFSIVSQG